MPVALYDSHTPSLGDPCIARVLIPNHFCTVRRLVKTKIRVDSRQLDQLRLWEREAHLPVRLRRYSAQPLKTSVGLSGRHVKYGIRDGLSGRRLKWTKLRFFGGSHDNKKTCFLRNQNR